MVVGVQFTGNVAGSSSKRWFTWGWPQAWETVWTVVPTTPRVGAPQIEWDVAVERASATAITYWITIRNLTSLPLNIEARYAIMNI
jgi:hypothetical protein